MGAAVLRSVHIRPIDFAGQRAGFFASINIFGDSLMYRTAKQAQQGVSGFSAGKSKLYPPGRLTDENEGRYNIYSISIIFYY